MPQCGRAGGITTDANVHRGPAQRTARRTGRGCGFGIFPYLECGRPRVGRAGPVFTGLPLWQSNWMCTALVAPGVLDSRLDEAQRAHRAWFWAAILGRRRWPHAQLCRCAALWIWGTGRAIWDAVAHWMKRRVMWGPLGHNLECSPPVGPNRRRGLCLVPARSGWHAQSQGQ